jgi:hypothetical protein
MKQWLMQISINDVILALHELYRQIRTDYTKHRVSCNALNVEVAFDSRLIPNDVLQYVYGLCKSSKLVSARAL